MTEAVRPRRRRSPAQPGDEPRPTTLRDVAAHAGVSVATVSRVLAENYPVAPATRKRVLRAVNELNFVANTHARALRGMVTRTVAFVLNDVRGQSFAAAAQGAQEEAAQSGRLCLICTTQGDPERELAVIRLMREQGAEAVILIGGAVEDAAYRARMTEVAHALDAVGSRLVFCGRPPLGPDLPLTVVEYDNEGGAYAVTTQLLANGHRKIVMLGGDPRHSTTAGRRDGYRRALADFGVEPYLEPEQPDEFSRAAGYRRTRELLDSGVEFSAIFACTDVVAAGVLAALADAGKRVPEDVSIVGYDDIDLASDLRPQLTTVHVPYEELGRTAVRLALRRRQPDAERAEQHMVLGTHVVVRKSVARVSDR